MLARSSRVHLAIPVFVYGHGPSDEPFQENTQTVTINANGGLIQLATPVVKDQAVLMTNMKTGAEISCRVAFVGAASNGKTEVGVRFDEPSPRFWGLNFPPEDWDPSLRKRPDPIRR